MSNPTAEKQRCLAFLGPILERWYNDLPPIVFLPILVCAIPVLLVLVLLIPPKYTGLGNDD